MHCYRNKLRTGLLSPFVLLCLCAFTPYLSMRAAQASSGNEAVSLRLVSARQGREIASTALQQDGTTLRARDCSHIVHEIYEAAGYQYPYASSFDLYAGHDNFVRVRHPQPGDLITWRGHVGIVVNAKEHTFYSLVRSGLQTENYLSPYWRSRGNPRFYRFALDSSRLVQTSSPAHSTPSAKPNVTPISEVARKTAEKKTASAEPPEPDPSTAAAVDPGSNLNSIAIASERDRPTSNEVSAAIASLNDRSAITLRSGEPLRSAVPVVIYDDLKIEKLELKRDKGWARLKISSHARITDEGPDIRRRTEKLNWELQRTESGWLAIAPGDCTLVSRDAAVRVLSAQLADMTQSDAAARHEQALVGLEARIANLIGALLAD
jgi:hypothetical protein